MVVQNVYFFLLTQTTKSYAISFSIHILPIFLYVGSFAQTKRRPRNVLPLADVTNCELVIYFNSTEQFI